MSNCSTRLSLQQLSLSNLDFFMSESAMLHLPDICSMIGTEIQKRMEKKTLDDLKQCLQKHIIEAEYSVCMVIDGLIRLKMDPAGK